MVAISQDDPAAIEEIPVGTVEKMLHFPVLSSYCTARLFRRRLARFRHSLMVSSSFSTSSVPPTHLRSGNLYWKRGRILRTAFIWPLLQSSPSLDPNHILVTGSVSAPRMV